MNGNGKGKRNGEVVPLSRCIRRAWLVNADNSNKTGENVLPARES